MKRSMQISALIIFTFLVVFPRAATSEVKITLKNGRDIIADSCSDSKDRVVCVKMGGSFEIDKNDVIHMKQVTIYKKEAPSGADVSKPEENPPSIKENAGAAQKDSGNYDSGPSLERRPRR